ncbi:MAG: trypsin-like peptidase domain-containing protein [Gammaproteobacteria bacterium]|nr:trypsin-like peptidase domain-containing protein [Gammaproteobacteria bacterium]
MLKKLHSTHFLFGWVIVGLIMGGVFLSIWPSPTNKDKLPAPDDITTPVYPASYADAVSKAAAAVVSIQALHQINQPRTLLEQLQGVPGKTHLRPNQGSGVIIDHEGHILTNYHVIADATEILVTLNDGRQFVASVVGADPDTDLAVITIKLEKLPNIIFAESHRIRVGDIVLAIGNPFGIGQTVTQGIISATGRDRVGLNTYENFIQTDAAINPGNSGGALINTRGEIVGINAAMFSQSGSFQGISFAIPTDMALKVVKQIIQYGGVIRGWLGVEGVDLNPQMLERLGLTDIQGVLVTDVFTNGPADKAGIIRGDIITHINNTLMRDARDMLDIIAQGRPGDSIEINGIRKGQSFNTKVTLAQRPQESR